MFVVVVPVTEGSVPLRHPLAGLHGPLSSSVRLFFLCKNKQKALLLLKKLLLRETLRLLG